MVLHFSMLPRGGRGSAPAISGGVGGTRKHDRGCQGHDSTNTRCTETTYCATKPGEIIVYYYVFLTKV